LLKSLDGLLADPQQAKKIGAAARETVERYQGATEKTLEAISESLSRRFG
jgi:hypothetical protein